MGITYKALSSVLGPVLLFWYALEHSNVAGVTRLFCKWGLCLSSPDVGDTALVAYAWWSFLEAKILTLAIVNDVPVILLS